MLFHAGFELNDTRSVPLTKSLSVGGTWTFKRYLALVREFIVMGT